MSQLAPASVKQVHDLPKSVQLHLRRASIDATETLLLSFDEDWNWLEFVGDLARFELAQVSSAELSDLIRSLCIGLPRVRGAELLHVGLPNGRFVDLHVFSAKARVHVLFLDVREEVEKTRVWQQSAQETELRSYEKTREIRKQRVTLASLKASNTALAWELALSQARLNLVRHELLAYPNADRMTQSAVFTNAVSVKLSLRSDKSMDLSELASEIGKRVPGQISVRTDSKGRYHASASQCALGFLPLLMFAHARTGVNTPVLAAVLSADELTVRLSVHAGMQDLSTVESALLWRHELPDRATGPVSQRLSASELALVLCAERQAEKLARLTRTFEPENGLQLTMSLVLDPFEERPDAQAPMMRTRIALAVGARVSYLGMGDAAEAALVQALVQAKGLVFEQVFQPDALSGLAKVHAPQAVVLDAALPGAGKLAFALRSHGFTGLIIATGPVKAGAAVLSAFDYQCTNCSAGELNRGLFGS
jgi:hypothetical protein